MPYDYPDTRTPQDYADYYTREETYRYTRAPVELAMTLVADAYRDEDFFRLEQQRVYGTGWLAVGYLEEVAEPGQFIVREVAGQSIIVTRDKMGELQAFYNTCRHRGAKLCNEDGKVTRFRCPYHSWGYDLTGNCIGTPLFEGSDIPEDFQGVFDMSDVKAFDRADYGLFKVKVASWGFFLFVNLDLDAVPLETYLGDLPERLANYGLESWQVVRTKNYEINANWKLISENFMEYYHLPWVHPELAKVSKIEDHYRYQGTGMYTGMTTTPISDNSGSGGWKGLPPAESLNEQEQVSGRFISLFPNICLSVLPNHAFVMMLEPQAAGFTLEKCALLCHPDSLGGGAEAELDQLLKFWDLVNIEDIEIVEAVQEGLKNKPYMGGRMCFKFEEGVHRFQNMVIDRMVGITDRIPEGDDEEKVRMFGPPDAVSQPASQPVSAVGDD